MKTIETFINEIKTNETLQMQLAEATKTNTLADFLKAQGCEATEEEFITAIKEQSEELSEDDLDDISGGINSKRFQNTCASIFTLGLYCAVEAVKSAIGDGSGKTNLLCDDPDDKQYF